MDGSVAVYAVPEPGSFGDSKDGPIYGALYPLSGCFLYIYFWLLVKAMRPVVRITVPDARFTCLDWANSEVMAIGCSNGRPGSRSSA